MARNDRNWWNRSPGDIEAALTWVEEQMQGGGGSSASLIHQASRTLTHAEILTLFSVKQTIVPTPGTNKLIVPSVIIARMDWVADYSALSGFAGRYIACDLSSTFVAGLFEDTLSGMSALLAGGGPDGTIVAFTLNQLARAKTTTATPEVNAHFHQGAVDSGFYDSDLADHPLTIGIYGGSEDLQDGNAGNALNVCAEFKVYSLAENKFLTTDESGWNESTRTFE